MFQVYDFIQCAFAQIEHQQLNAKIPIIRGLSYHLTIY